MPWPPSRFRLLIDLSSAPLLDFLPVHVISKRLWDIPLRMGIELRAVLKMRSLLVAALLAVVACGSPRPAPVPGTPLTVPDLKFAVMDAVGKPSYCDPDFWPLAHDEMPNALAQYGAIRADAETYAAILAHEHLPSGDLTDAQKLAVYRAWKLLRAVVLTQNGDEYSFDYRVALADSFEMVVGTVTVTGKLTVTARTATTRPDCPICLAASTLIATPTGSLRVTDIRAGSIVWTLAPDGSHVAAPVIEVGSTAVPANHHMVHLVLADGRELLVSPGHRTADGRQAGDLKAGDQLDGSTIARWELVPYAGGRTYDLLPAGATGFYW